MRKANGMELLHLIAAGRDKVQRSLLSVREGPNEEQVTGLAFKGGALSRLSHDPPQPLCIESCPQELSSQSSEVGEFCSLRERPLRCAQARGASKRCSQ